MGSDEPWPPASKRLPSEPIHLPCDRRGGFVTGLAGKAVERPASLRDLLGPGLDADPDGPALMAADTRLTWRALDGMSDRLAANLLGLGMGPGDRAASLMPNRPALVVYYLACFKAGLVATPLNYRYMAPEIDHALDVSRARVLLAHVERDEDLAASELAGKLPLGRITYGAGRNESDLRGADRGRRKAVSRLARPPVAIRAGRHFLHFREHRTPERGYAHARDPRMDARDSGGRTRAQIG